MAAMLPPPSRPLASRKCRVGQHEGDGAEADDEGQDVEVADPGGGPQHRLARFLGVGHGEEAHQDVRQAGGAEHQRHAEADGGDRVLDEGARAHDREADLGRLFGGLAALAMSVLIFTALANIASGLKPKCHSTISAMKVAPPSSMMALMICTQVVAVMPPNST
jgi:hypothetical protein